MLVFIKNIMLHYAKLIKKYISYCCRMFLQQAQEPVPFGFAT